MPFTVDFEPHAQRQYDAWRKREPWVADRIDRLLEALRQDPFAGIGKTEKLRGNLSGHYSEIVSNPRFCLLPPFRSALVPHALLHSGRSLHLRRVSKPGKAPGFETGSSCRITEAHRLVYEVEGRKVFICSCYGHY
jgi:Txe/YoeB family toxin of Txe-Axe toxin-antitoxin module